MKDRIRHIIEGYTRDQEESRLEFIDFRLIDIPFVKKGVSGSDEDAYAFGSSVEDYEFWRPHICGVCCYKTIGDAIGQTNNISLSELSKQFLDNGVFTLDSDKTVRGAYHYPLAKMLHNIGVPAKVAKRLPIDEVGLTVDNGGVVLLSVDLSKVPNSPSTESHLIVVYGHDAINDTYTLHDSASVLAPHGGAALMRAEDLYRISNSRGLIVGKWES